MLSFVLGAACVSAPARAESTDGGADPARSAIVFYQRHLSAMRHMHCRFTPSCSQYAIDAIAAYGVVEGSARAADRLMRCNEGADTRYAPGTDGLLSDPATGPRASVQEIRAPEWLSPPSAPDAPPVAVGVSADRRARLAEAIEFARQLEQRGDVERASSEFQRAGMLADTLAAQSWAFTRVGDGWFRAEQWLFADRAYLTAAMLEGDPSRRAAIGWSSALSRFDAGAYVACASLLADSALAPAAMASEERADARAHVVSLEGLCAFAVGSWDVAERDFALASRVAPDAGFRARAERLRPFVVQGRALPHRSPAFAGALSTFVPGAGQAYAGHVRDGLRHLLFNAALGYTVYALASNEQVPASVIVGSVALPFYFGNVIGARESARRFDREQRMRLLARAIEDSAR
ncbi:MAG: membrane protein insertion efficiency factor YidD [Candidatus Eisenbacteria bacterium]|uniref:Membrane protein insertion efficiency factor YidD n=1 Tax=Eiseniibacteriota bacterium TaxID=2212470 RepID=A0A933SCH4_UNCEI|nr:membrane protein insertion efficiency factor YidD [Candidatus Eisenbacteria bacterium]